jgi:SAM-dependent methyltransferase
MTQPGDPKLSPRAQAALAACAQGRMPPNLAAMHLVMEGAEPAAFDRAIAEAAAPEAAERLSRARSLASVPAAALLRRTAALLEHDPAAQGESGAERWAAAFDRAVAAHPEASVALYSLGDPRLLDAASAEIAAVLGRWGVLGSDRRALDLGCGIGRMLPLLARSCRVAVGIDVSAGMLTEARRRCTGLSNLLLVRSSGRDLKMFADDSFDLVLAVDSFPYLNLSGIAEPIFAELARLLAPGGDLGILNYSYRDDFEADRADLDRLARAHGLKVLRRGTRDFELWDAPGFLLKKPS